MIHTIPFGAHREILRHPLWADDFTHRRERIFTAQTLPEQFEALAAYREMPAALLAHSADLPPLFDATWASVYSEDLLDQRASELDRAVPGSEADCGHAACQSSAVPSEVWEVIAPEGTLPLGFVCATSLEDAYSLAVADYGPERLGEYMSLGRLSKAEAELVRATLPQRNVPEGLRCMLSNGKVLVEYQGLSFPASATRAILGAPARWAATVVARAHRITGSTALGSLALTLNRHALRVTTGPLQW